MPKFNVIDLSTWKRTAIYNLYTKQFPCSYSMTVNLDITNLQRQIKEHNIKLYPAILYALTTIVNRFPEFRMSLNENGEVGLWDEIAPSYTTFNPNTELVSVLWFDGISTLMEFSETYESDRERYKEATVIHPKGDASSYHFPVSMIPWVPFTSFNLNVSSTALYLLPIFTLGKFTKVQKEEKEITLLPLSIQVHHAACDGYHVGRFIDELQQLIDSALFDS